MLDLFAGRWVVDLVLIVLALVAVGFGAGWWARGR